MLEYTVLKHSNVSNALQPNLPYYVVYFLAPAVTVGERRELWILPPFFLASSFAYNFVRR